MEVQEKDIFVWVETQTPAISVCFRTWFYIAGVIGTSLYKCIYTYVSVYMLIDACGYMYLLKAHKLIMKNDPSCSLKFFRFILRI